MAQRRMFSKNITENDAFLDMPLSTQALYFHLGMQADDDGFVSPHRIMRMIGAQSDDLKILAGKKFVLPFEDGVVVVKHWLINNYIQRDRYVPTTHKEKFAMLTVKENNGYKMDTECIQNVRLGKDSIGKVRLEEKKDSRFAPPSPKEVDEYCQSIGYSVDGEAFCGFYDSNGWKVGKNPMRSWKGAVATWEKRNNPKKKVDQKERFQKLRKQIMKNFTGMREAYLGSKIEGFDIHKIDDEITMLSGGVWTLTPEVEQALNSPELFKRMEAKLYELNTSRKNSTQIH